MTANDQAKRITSAVVVKWLLHHEQIERFKYINEKIDRMEARHNTSDLFKSVMSVFKQSAHEVDSVVAFWDDDDLKDQIVNADKMGKSIPFRELRALLKLQTVVKLWIAKKNFLAKNAKFENDDDKNDSDMLFTTLKTYHARAQTRLLEINKLEIDEQFKEFCTKLKKTKTNPGFPIKMFGRKYGNVAKRYMYFSDDFNYIQYKPNRWTTSSIELKSIYEISKGVSKYDYQNAKITHNAWCFHLKSLEGRVYDFEALSANHSKTLYNGFKRLIKLFYGDSPFYIDKNGIPRRAGASIISNCLNTKEKSSSLHMSKADTERYRYAIRMLKSEYASWESERKKEQDEWEKVEEARILEDRAQLKRQEEDDVRINKVKLLKKSGNKDVIAAPEIGNQSLEKSESVGKAPVLKGTPERKGTPEGKGLIGKAQSSSKDDASDDDASDDDASDDDASDEDASGNEDSSYEDASEYVSDASEDDLSDEDASEDEASDDASEDDASDDDLSDEDASEEEEQEEGEEEEEEEEEEED